MAEIVVVEQGKGNAGIETGGERTLVNQNRPQAAAAPSEGKELSEEELAKARREVDVAMGWAKPEPQPEPAPEPTTPIAAPPVVETPATPAPAAPAAPATPAAPTTDELIQRTASETAKAVTERLAPAQPAAEPAAEPVEPELTPEDARDVEIAAKMEELDPKLKGKAEEVKKFAHARYEYEKKWLEANPGQAFDPDSDDHSEFYKAQPHIDERLYDEAKIELAADRLVQKRLGPVQQQLEQQKAEKILEQARPAINEAVNKRVHNVVEKTDPALAALLMVDGKVNLSKPQIDKLIETDPIAAEVLEPMIVGELLPIMAELEKTTISGLNYQFDPENNRVHARIGEYLHEAEEAAAKDAKLNTRDGKTLVSLAARGAAVSKIMKSKGSDEAKRTQVDDYDSKHFTLSIDDLQEYVVSDISKRAKSEIERLDKLAQKKYKKGDQSPAPKPVQAAPTPAPTPTPSNNSNPKPPSISASDATVDTTRPPGGGEKSFGQQAVETHWRK